MTKVAVTETYLTDIADAIRQQTGSVGTYKPSEMADAILDISGGGGSSGGGSSCLALNIIIENGSKYKLDKTVSEIVQALNSGISPVFIETNGAYKNYYPLKSAYFDSYNHYHLSISCTGYENPFSAIGLSDYPSFTKAGGGGSND